MASASTGQRRHPKKVGGWDVTSHRGSRQWLFHDFVVKDGRKISVKLCKEINTKIVIHTKVEGELNPFLPEWEPKLEGRATLRMINNLKEHKRLLRLWLSQDQKCPVCERPIIVDEAFDAHHIHPKQLGGSDKLSNWLSCTRTVIGRCIWMRCGYSAGLFRFS
jgi:RNA-directed DNA polymerase